ncbi:MAG: YbdK family carboxylate-amine ligase [Actinobacteria bacterium]|nr:YbdK family carboxylate-amine ligase [Actinomycetota bacterium]
MIDHRFGSAPAWSLGVEEELLLVDAETLLPARDGFTRVFGEARERIKPELLEAFVEVTTPVVATPEEAEAELCALRREVAERAALHGLAVVAAGSHPTATPDVPIVPVPRYQRMAEELGPRLYRQLVCGLHVHVSVPAPETCLRAFEGVVPHLPRLLGESVNSPFWEGRDSGWRSIRAQRLLEMPTGGTPPVLRSWDDWQAASRGDSTRRHWDAWPRPELGTLEVRVMDQPTSLARTRALVAEVQRLVREASEAGVAEPMDRDAYAAERDRAARVGPGPEAARQLELGPEQAVAEIAALSVA